MQDPATRPLSKHAGAPDGSEPVAALTSTGRGEAACVAMSVFAIRLGRRPRRSFSLWELDGASPRRQAGDGRRGGWARYILSTLRAQAEGIPISPPRSLFFFTDMSARLPGTPPPFWGFVFQAGRFDRRCDIVCPRPTPNAITSKPPADHRFGRYS